MKTRVSILLVVLVIGSLVSACGAKPTQTPQPTAAAKGAANPTSAAASDNRPAVPAPPADGSRPLAKLAPAERNNRYSSAAAMFLKPNTTYVATIVTSKGKIVAELYRDTPQSANNFVTLALNGYYDGLTFHRVEPGFVVQGGDPAGDGAGGPCYTIPAEIKHSHPRGALAWARTCDQINPQRRSSGSQFYITLDETSFLDGQYTVFGLVVAGMEITDQIAVGDKIVRVDISEAQVSRLPTPTPAPAPRSPMMEPGRPLASLPLEGREYLYNTPPTVMTVDLKKSYQATIKTAQGDIVIDLDPQRAPVSVNNFVLLANLGYYDNMPVAYVQSETYAVFGSPAGRPDSDIGYTLAAEVAPADSQILTGTVSFFPIFEPDGTVLANGSQFFISFSEAPESDAPLNVIGKVSRGIEIVAKLEIGEMIASITITEK